MTTNILIAGFGGQGILFAGKFLAYKGLMDEKQVSWLPSYGPEMRGGTANCSVIIADKPIASPIVSNPTLLVAMNGASLDKFADKVTPGGVILVNSSLIAQKVERKDVRVYYVPANEMALDLGTAKAANIIMLGAINRACEILKHEFIRKGIEYGFKTKPHLVDMNVKVYEAGYQFIK